MCWGSEIGDRSRVRGPRDQHTQNFGVHVKLCLHLLVRWSQSSGRGVGQDRKKLGKTLTGSEEVGATSHHRQVNYQRETVCGRGG